MSEIIFKVKQGTHERITAAPIHRKDGPEATAQSLCGHYIEPVPPTWRDLWAILRGRYVPCLRVGDTLTVAAVDRTLKDTWTADRLETALHDSPLLDALKDKEMP